MARGFKTSGHLYLFFEKSGGMEGRDMRDSEALARFYAKCWVYKYNEQPPVSEDDAKVFEFLANTYTLQKATEIIQTFFRMDDPAFLSDGHKPILIKWHIRRIAAELGKSKKPCAVRRIELRTWCGLCAKEFTACVSSHETTDEDMLCSGCRLAQRWST